MTMPATLLSFIIMEADEHDLDRIIQSVKDRRKVLRDARAAAVQIGADVTLDNLSPKYLNGLEGTVVVISGKRADVRLTEKSTGLLRFSGTRFHVPEGTTEYVLRGVPLSTCLPRES